MELKINEITFPEVISFNFEELKAEITKKADLYKNMVYTDQTIKEAKADKAKLNKFINALEDKRKEVKRQCLQPYEDFERRIKELVAIVDEPVQLIDSHIKDFEDRKKAAKLEMIKEHWESIERPEWLKCNQIFDKRWLNATVSLNKVYEEIQERIAKIEADMDTIERLPEFAFEALEVYKQTLDLSQAISEGQRLADIQKRKEQQARQAEQKADVVQEPENALPDEGAQAEEICDVNMPSSMDDELRSWIKFEALLSVQEAKDLGNYLKSRGIQIRAI